MRKTLDIRQMSQRLAEVYGDQATGSSAKETPAASNDQDRQSLWVFVDYGNDLFRFR